MINEAVPLFEFVQDVDQVVEEEEEGKKKNYYLTGVYTECEVKNSNNRVYPRPIVEREVKKLREKIDSGVAFGEFGHPKEFKEISDINPARVSHRILEINQDGNIFKGKSVIIPEGMGKIATAMIDTGGKLSISSRAVGRVQKSTGVVENNYRLYTYDIVFNPGMKKAFQECVLENKSVLVDELGVFTEEEWRNIKNHKLNISGEIFKFSMFNALRSLIRQKS
jgi:hypothetical protein